MDKSALDRSRLATLTCERMALPLMYGLPVYNSKELKMDG